MTTQESNRLIALFMAQFEEYESDKEDAIYWAEHGSPLSYHEDWNCLIPVVEKIEYILSGDSLVTIEYKDCRIPIRTATKSFDIVCTGNTKLEAVYSAAIEFIKWYNQNQ